MARGARWAVGTTAVLLVLGAGGYAVADAYDVAPGRLTLASPPPTPAPFPTADVAPAPDVAAVLGELDPQAPLPSGEAVAALAATAVADPRLGSSTTVVVTDVLTGQVIADVGGRQPQEPASTTKILTAAAATEVLGPDATLTTSVVQAAPGTIVLVGGGDMMLAAGAGDPAAVNGRAGLADLAAQVAQALTAAGVTQVTLGLDDTLFTGPSWNPGWAPDHNRYVAPISALAIDIGHTSDHPYSVRQPDPALEAARQLARALGERGVAVVGDPVRMTAPEGATRLGAVESASMREIVRLTVQESENTIAEVLGRLVAIATGEAASFEGATRAVVGTVAGLGLDTTGTVIADCSGLAAGSRIPADLLVDVLVLAGSPAHPELLPVVDDLAVGGWTGTLLDRFGQGPARGLVRAKTGSLPGVTSLAGTVLTQGGRLLAFAVMADATGAVGQDRPRAAIDELVTRLAAVPPAAAG
ncbi:D-alanyl-D-alanine carboxypeptidase/D-alanyl-D-alanine endopeptidase [Actinotalea fermentans]|nr:D-alanyl-D-alanine carboxypeptidase/D-alanyl-D-alanine-endopeptidase [Actinotalea fermentans]